MFTISRKNEDSADNNAADPDAHQSTAAIFSNMMNIHGAE
ncbi:hypothetical protein AXX16_4448 [Serratia rubidaea]|nr:hypothetical protein AXX16_4448 [Serratia rubidaea]